MLEPRFSNLNDWLQWQESLHGQEIDLGLDRIRRVYQRMNLSWSDTVFVTVGGTNGKGSTIAFLNAIYQQAGYKVGQFTSPHFLRYNERMQLNAQPVDDQSLCDAFAEIDRAREDISLTYFEFSTLAALYLFAQQSVDVVLLEVGLGGRLDASNLIDADCSIVTSIGIDHRDWLGDTREAIGFEKAGIYRGGRPAICGDSDIPHTVRDHAQQIEAQWWGRGEQFDIELGQRDWQLHYGERALTELPYPQLSAPVQLDNAACAVLAVQLLAERLPVAQQALQQGIRIAAVPGRMQCISTDPFVILDVAHNEAAAQSVVDGVRKHYADRPVRLVLGMLADKEVEATLEVLAQLNPIAYMAAPDSPRALAAQELANKAVNWPIVSCFGSVAEAFCAARGEQQADEVLLVVGSFFTVAEVMGEMAGGDV